MPLTARVGRAIAAGALALTALVGVGGCQFQTLQQYTPGDGVNTSIGSVLVRNVVIVVTAPGEGVLLGTLVGDESDTLRTVSGVALKPNGDPGAALQVTSTTAVSVTPNTPVLLQDQPIRVTSADLIPGLTARVELTFASAGAVTVVVPVLDKNSPEYVKLEFPTPSPSATGS